MTRPLRLAAFCAGLAALAWVAAGYLPSHLLALGMTVLITAGYLGGAWELRRYDQATAGLRAALQALPPQLPALGPWLDTLPAALRTPVRQRVEGDRAGLPAPVMTPYLAGLLVLLGMLGTFLGMVVTLHGTGAALQHATDLLAMRDSLSAPVQGLGLAFGTSVAGVAGSAMLGLMSALSRRERLAAAQALDAALATSLRPHTPAQRRDAELQLLEQQRALLQRQGDWMQQQAAALEQQAAMLAQHTLLMERQAGLQERQAATLERQTTTLPVLVERVLASMGQLERHGQQLGDRLEAHQARFHGETADAYRALAASVDRTLGQSLTDSARAAAATIQPVVEATMQGITRETAALHGRIADQVRAQLEDQARQFDATTSRVAAGWHGALDRHEAATGEISRRLAATLDGFGERFEHRAAALAEAVAETQRAWQAEMAAAVAGLSREGLAQQERLAGTTGERLAEIGARLDSSVARLTGHWDDVLARHEQTGSRLIEGTARTLEATVERLQQQAGSLIDAVQARHQAQDAALQARVDAHDAAMQARLEARDAAEQARADARDAALQARLEARDAQRLSAWTERLDMIAATLRQGWAETSEATVAGQREICTTLSTAAREITAQAEAHTRGTVDEIARLLQSAGEAPRVAAELVSQLRQQLSESLARDTAMLDERRHILDTLGSLLDTVQHAATQQKCAIDDLVAGATTLLDEAGRRHVAQVEDQGARLEQLAVDLGSGAVEVASLGEALGTAVQRFDQANDKLVGQLQRIEAALGQSLSRSDEQLAYYVAQAREVIDLSLSSQQQIVEDLQRLAADRRQAQIEAEPAN